MDAEAAVAVLLVSGLAFGAPTDGASSSPEDLAAPEARPAQEADPPPGCWIRGEPEDLELRISRLDSAAVELDGGTVKVCYSRPRKLGRPIMGRLVPFGEPWRLGANEATVLHLPFPATVAGVDVDPGSYSLYAIPDEESWQIVVNRTTRRWGIPIDGEVRQADVGSARVPAESLDEVVERLTMRLVRTSDRRARLRIEWERTGVSVPIERRPEEPGSR